MVGINELEASRQRRIRDESEVSGMTEWDWQIVGKEAVRLHIPVTNRYHIRQIVGRLRRFLEEVDVASRLPDMSEKELILSLRLKAKIAQRDMDDICGIVKKSRNRKPFRDI